MSLEFTIQIISILFSIAIIFQTVENLLLKNIFDNEDVIIWDWKILTPDFEFLPKPLKKILNEVMNNKAFFYLLWLRLITSMIILFFPSSLNALGPLIIFFTTLLISIRFRGSFNGGSDYMTLILSGAFSILFYFQHQQKIIIGCLWYIAIQVTLSYFFSGIAKIKIVEWRNGEALSSLVVNPHYDVPSFMKKILSKQKMALVLSWLIMAFEILFPLVFIAPQLLKLFLVVGFLFHLSNFFSLGLNRFFWIWMATYPALCYMVLHRY